MLDDSSLRAPILEGLYTFEFTEQGKRNLEEMRAEHGWEPTPFWNFVDRMVHDELIEPWTMGGNYRILPAGILAAEDEALAPQELIADNRRIRTLTLDTLATTYQTRGSLADLSIDALAQSIGYTPRQIADNLHLLEKLWLVEPVAGSSVKITFQGLDAVEEWRRKLSLAQQFDQVAQLPPHERGRQFQSLMANVFERDGWMSQESVRTKSEEIDVIFSKGREYFLVECKWEKDPIQAAAIRELFGKVSNRVEVRGIVVSMSGFTEGAIAQSKDYASQRAVILFGPADVERLVGQLQTVDESLTQKYEALVTRREVLVS